MSSAVMLFSEGGILEQTAMECSEYLKSCTWTHMTCLVGTLYNMRESWVTCSGMGLPRFIVVYQTVSVIYIDTDLT